MISEGMIRQEIVYADNIDFFQSWIMSIIPMEGF
jgi:hypothetical protein